MSFFGGLGLFGKSVGKAVDMGLDLGVGRGFKPKGLGSIATLGTVGFGLGMASTMFSENTVNPLGAGAVGGAVGALGLPVAGATAGLVGSGIIGGAKAMPSVMGGIGTGIIGASPYVAGTAAYGTAKIGSALWNVGSRMINWDVDADAFNKVKFTGPISGARLGWQNNKGWRKVTGSLSGGLINGATILGGVSAVEGFREAYGKVEKAKMGTNMGVQSLTPRVPAYADNAGATGDLVFALNANRKGMR